MSNSIPASQLVEVVPGVLGAGGNPLSLNAVFLTEDPAVPVGAVQFFATYSDVAAFFGATSDEAAVAQVYFAGFTGCSTLPGGCYFVQFNTVNVGAYTRGASVASLSLSALQALTGSIVTTVDGQTSTSAAINLSSATSFGNAAQLIQTAVQVAGGIFAGTATQTAGTNVMNVTAVNHGVLSIGDIIAGTNVDSGLTIVSFGTGTGGTGTYNVSTTTGFTSTAVTVSTTATVSYDAQRKAFVIASTSNGSQSTVGYVTDAAGSTFAASVNLTQAKGAVLSQGALQVAPAALMNSVVAVTQNWATFMTIDEQVDSVKLAFAAWSTAQNSRYLFVAADSNANAITTNASSTFGVLTKADNGVCAVYDISGQSLIAAFICGTTAAIDFTEANGRITYAYKGQAGLFAQVTDATQAANLIANGYNFYGAYATANQQFTFLQNGQVSGAWSFIDEFVNQISLNSALQLAMLSLLSNVKSVPYNTKGYTLVRSACGDPIKAAIAFGSIQAGVALSAAQIAEVNTAAGLKIDSVLSATGYYLQILPASAQTRGTRSSPPMTLWYTDGGSIQKLNLASIDVQ